MVKIFLDVNARVDVFDQEARYKHSLVRICLMVDFFFKVLGDHQISIFLRSALHLAAESGNADICEMLLSKNAYVNRYTAWILFSHRVTFFFSKTKAGWTPLHYVAYKGYNELIKALVTKHNAAIDATSMVRTTFL